MFSALEKWISEGGGVVSPKIEIKQFTGRGRGVVATDDIKPGERLILIRNSQLINMKNVYPYFLNLFPEASAERNEAIALLNTVSAQGIMALFLLLEQASVKSPWLSFLSVLPTVEDLETIPLTWERGKETTPQKKKTDTDKDQVNEWDLLSKSTQEYVLKQEKNFLRDFNGCQKLHLLLNSLTPPAAINLSKMTSSQYKHAWLCVNSRCLYHTLTEASSPKSRAFNWKASDNLTMAPYVDFLNHSTDTTLHCVAKTVTLGFEVSASPTSGYKKGQEILLCYGAHSNEKLLCEYGFCVDENPWETVDITNEIVLGYIQNAKMTDFTKEIDSLLNKYDYSDGYTINNHGLSFRTEVAIMAYLLYSKKNAIATRDPERSLNAFMNGLATLSDLKIHMKLILREILINVQGETTDLIQHTENLDHKNVVKKLAMGKLTVVQNVLDQLKDEF